VLFLFGGVNWQQAFANILCAETFGSLDPAGGCFLYF
jgi:hypothetical protein